MTLILPRTLFDKYAFYFEPTVDSSLRDAVSAFLEKSEWIDLESNKVERLLSVADRIDESDFEISDSSDGNLFQKADDSYPAIFPFSSEYANIEIQISSRSILAGFPLPEDSMLFALRIGREYKQLYKDAVKREKLYRSLCQSFDSNFIKFMYGGPPADLYRYFFGHRNGVLSNIDNCPLTDLLPPLGIFPKASLSRDYETVLESSEVESWWAVGADHVFIDAWPKWFGTYEDKYKELARNLGFRFTLYDIPDAV